METGRGELFKRIERLPEEEQKEDVEELKRLLEEEKSRSQDLLNRLKYAQADLENFRKRADKEARDAGEADLRALVGRLLQVKDQLELAAKHLQGGSFNGEVSEGVGMVQRNLSSALESAGVQKIACVGKPFDPSLHEAVEKVQGSGEGDDMVVEELRPGYTFRGQLIRPSMVKVELASRTPAEEAEAK